MKTPKVWLGLLATLGGGGCETPAPANVCYQDSDCPEGYTCDFRQGYCLAEKTGAIEIAEGKTRLLLSPDSFDAGWVGRNTLTRLRARVWLSEARPLGRLVVYSPQPWIEIAPGPLEPDGSRLLEISLDSSDLANGRHEGWAMLSEESKETDGEIVTPGVINVVVQVTGLFRVGPEEQSCGPRTADVSHDSTCDFWGEAGLEQAAEAAAALPGARILVYDDDGAPATFTGGFRLPGRTGLSAAPGVSRDDVQLLCQGDAEHPTRDAALILDDDDCQVSDLTLLVRAGCNAGLSTWINGTSPTGAGRGHRIENLVVYASSPPLAGTTTITPPLLLGPDSVVRNSYFYGYFRGYLPLQGAHRSRLSHNTFVWYRLPDPNGMLLVGGSSDLQIVNNVMIWLSRTADRVLGAGDPARRLILTGNVFEGARKLGSELLHLDGYLEGNAVGQAQVVSPLAPQFLADSSQRACQLFAEHDGVSLDGVSLSDGASLPGAFQQRAEVAGPRRMLTRLGGAANDCGDEPCDLVASTPGALQRAMWSTWPGGVIELYPAAQPYVGRMVTSWGLTLRGMGDAAEDVVLTPGAGVPVVPAGGEQPPSPRQSLIEVLKDTGGPLIVENLSLEVRDGQPVDQLLLTEPASSSGISGPHQLRRLRLLAPGGATAQRALVLGHWTVVQDVLIRGAFGTCAAFGDVGGGDPHHSSGYASISNLTCRLTGTGALAPIAGFVADHVSGGLMANMAIELSAPAPLFLATHPPVACACNFPSFWVHSISVRGALPDVISIPADYEGAARPTVNNQESIDQVGAPALFMGPEDDRLTETCGGVDSGIWHQDSWFNEKLSRNQTLLKGFVEEEALNNSPRTATSKVDRGAFEQGL